MSTVISVDNLTKKYTLRHQQREHYTALRDVIADKVQAFGRRALHPFRSSSGTPHSSPKLEDFWALKDVSFDIEQGDRVGIIGRNGAGKSTLLKILSRITEPTSGRVKIKGRVASLLEVGTGFHPELTGRENIFLNGAILGMGRVEIKKKFDEIVEFAEIEKFLDTPVKRYSTGMYVRLAFAVAAHLEPEILVVDEVLAVGDAQFQKKCLGKMENVSAQEGRTVLFVSHNMSAIQSLCKRTINLDSGGVTWDGNVAGGISRYLANISGNNNNLTKDRVAEGSGDIRISEAYVVNDCGHKVEAVLCGEDISICIKYMIKNNNKRTNFALDIYNSNGYRVAYCNSIYTSGDYMYTIPENSFVTCNFQKLPLFPDTYRIDMAVHCDGIRSDYIQGAMELLVNEGDFYGTGKIPIGGASQIVLLSHNWSIQ